jgi:aminoglycoside phosphotransferase (APT) family kinase protein
MRKQEVRDYLKKKTDFQESRLIDNFEGEHNQNFIFESYGKKYVLRKNREVVKNLSLDKERRILEFLNHLEIDFVPRSFHYDGERDIHIIEFVGENEVYLSELDDDLLDEWCQKLAQIHSIGFDEYRTFCSQEGYKVEEKEMDVDVGKKALEYLEYAEKIIDIEDIAAWTRKELENHIESETNSGAKDHLRHSDILGSTRTGDKLYFIDWEFSGFSSKPEHDLMDVFLYRDLGAEKIENIKKYYGKHRNLPDTFGEEFENYSRLKSIFQITWRLKKAAELKEKGESWKAEVEKARENKRKFVK